MIPHKITIAEAKKIDPIEYLASPGLQPKKISVIFSFHQQPSRSHVKETSKILINVVTGFQCDGLKINMKAAVYLLKQRGNTCW
ncbi:MAG: hypothetical protein M3Z26_08120 [Bacteroidota bacterium]|nr:hypothetical protein [Bacteroidota bacterium]